MKKNIFSDNESGRSSKGFYTALGISALMIGSACYFAYNQGEKLTENNFTAESSSSVSEAAVDKQYTDVPKITTAVITTKQPATTTVRVTTAAPVTTTHIATLPAAGIVKSDSPAEPAQNDTVSVEPEAVETAADRLANVSLPLADISNILTPFSGTELVKNETTGSWQTHNGIDIATEIGAEVFVISPGEITAVNQDPLWGNTVTIDHHNGYITKYCGLADDLSIQKGDTLVSGDVIGVVGDTSDIESAIPPHLHIEMIHNGTFIDPMSIFNS